MDLGMKICEKGYEINAAAEALVYHSKKTWIPVKAMFRRLNFYGTADCDLIHKHPDRGDVVLPKRSMLYIIYALFLVLAAIASGKWWVLAGIPLVSSWKYRDVSSGEPPFQGTKEGRTFTAASL